jgi:hypothetical protein
MSNLHEEIEPETVETWPSDRTLSEISLGCGCLSLIGVGAPVVTDSQIVMWGFIIAGCIGLVAVIALRIVRYLAMRQWRLPISLVLRTWRWTLASLIVAVLAIGIAAYFQGMSHFAAGTSAKDIAEEVSKLIADSGRNSRTPVMPANPANPGPPASPVSPAPSPNTIMQSSEGKALFICAVPPPPDAFQFFQKYQEYKSGVEAMGEVLDIKMSTSIINNGVRLTIEAISDEGKESMWRMTGIFAPKMTIEVRRVGQNEIVSFTVDRPGIPQSMLLNIPLRGSKDDIQKFERAVEQIVGAPPGVCHVF